MSGSTYLWRGGQGGTSEPNDVTVAANWWVLQGSNSVEATTTPQAGDTAEILSGTADFLFQPSQSVEIPGITFLLGGTGTTAVFQNLTLDPANQGPKTPISVLSGGNVTIDIDAYVLSHVTISVASASTSLAIDLNGTFDNQNVILATNGGTVAIHGTSGSTFDNEGGVVALGGDVTVTASMLGDGILLVANGVLTLDGSVSGAQSVVFSKTAVGTQQTLVIGDASQFSAKILGFQIGDTIDLANVPFADAPTVTVVGNVATVTDTAGLHVTLSLPGSGIAAIATTTDPNGGTDLIVPSVIDPMWTQFGSGDWATGGNWSTGTAPGTAETALIANLGSVFEVTVSAPETLGELVMLAPSATLSVQSTLAATRAIFDAVGTIAVAASSEITAPVFNLIGGGATLTMDSNALVSLLSGATIGNGNGFAAFDDEGQVGLNGATLAALDGSVRIGWNGNGTFDANGGSRIGASYTVLGAAAGTSGTLVIDNATWEDFGGDATAGQAGEMLVGGGQLGPAGFVPGGSGTLTIQDNAHVVEAAGAILGAGPNSSGTVIIQDGATWDINGNLTVGGNVSSSATLIVQQGTLLHTVGTLVVTGTLAVDGTLDVLGGSTANAGSLSFTGGTIGVDGSSVLNIGTSGASGNEGLVVDVGAAATFSGGASFAGPLAVLGTLVTEGATLNGSLAGPGTIAIASGTTLTVDDASPWSSDIAFAAGGSGDYVLSVPTADQGKIFFGSAGGVSDTLDLSGLAYTPVYQPTFDPASGILTLAGGSLNTITVTGIVAPGDAQFRTQHDTGTGTDIVMTLPCFTAGTRIATPQGDAAVEALREGDLVLTLEDGASVARPVRWVGRRHVDCRRHPRPQSVWPVRIAAGAFAEAQPVRDLYLSPDHAVFVAGVLIPVRYLLNGASIAQVNMADVTYCHVELPQHAVLLAEGLACESFLDTGGRAAFANGGAVVQMHPAFARDVLDGEACAPVVIAGKLLDRVRAALRQRLPALAAVPSVRRRRDRAVGGACGR